MAELQDMEQERIGVRLLHNARIPSTISGEMQRPGWVLGRAEDRSPLLTWWPCWKWVLSLHSPHVLFVLMNTHHLLTATSWVWEEAGPAPAQGDGTGSLSMCWAGAVPTPGITPFLVYTPFSLGGPTGSHRSVRAAVGRQSQVSQVSVFFSARETHDMSKCILWCLGRRSPEDWSNIRPKVTIGWGWGHSVPIASSPY